MEQQFREHAELLDRRFAEVHVRFDEIRAHFSAVDQRFAYFEHEDHKDHEDHEEREDATEYLAGIASSH